MVSDSLGGTTPRKLSPDNPCETHSLRLHDVCDKCGTPGFLEYLKLAGEVWKDENGEVKWRKQ